MTKLFSKFAAFICLISLLNILVACSGNDQAQEQSEKPSAPKLEDNQEPIVATTQGGVDLAQAIESYQEMNQKVELILRPTPEEDDGLTLEVVLLNPQQLEINSVRSFLTYNRDLLKGKRILIPEDSPFDTIAPGEKQFDQQNGVVKLGVSSFKGMVTEMQVTIAEIEFTKLTTGIAPVDFLDPRTKGFTQALANFRGRLENVLLPPVSPAYIFPSNLEQ
jgi:hypothetical protein